MNRLRAGMTQAELARAIGTTQSHVSEYESGARQIETMPAGEFVRLKAVLDVTDALLCVCSIESGPCERVDVFHVSGRFWSTSACGEKRTPARPAWTSFPS